METDPKISVIIPVLNAGKVLPKILGTVYSQDYKNIEIIINDDERTSDNTQNVIQEWKDKLDIKYIRKNPRLGAGRLEGAKVATGDLIYHVDADMEFPEGLLRECVDLVLNHQAKAITICENNIGEGFWAKCKWLEKNCYCGDDEIESPRFFVKTFYFEIGGHDPELAFYEDVDVQQKVKAASVKIMRPKIKIIHNEGKVSLIKAVKSKFFWVQTGYAYLNKRPKSAWKMALTSVFRPAFFRNWRLLLKHPILTIGMLFMKFAELSGAAANIFYTKILKREIKHNH